MRFIAVRLRQPLVIAALAACVPHGAASAIGWQTRMSCASDYYAFCSKFSVGTPEVRKCMRANGSRLSKGCINALIADGEISSAEVAKQREKLAAARAGVKAADGAKTKGEVKSETKAATGDGAPGDGKAAAAKTKAKSAKENDIAALPAPGRVSGARPSPAPIATPAKPAASLALALRLDAETYEALKSRGPYFVIEDDDAEPVFVVAATSGGAAKATDSAGAGAASEPAAPAVNAGRDVRAGEPRLTAGPAQVARRSTTDARSPEQARPKDYSEGRMSLGRETAPVDEAVGPLAWLDEFLRALFGAPN